MAKKTAVIDLGSNGIRMAVFEKTSRFAFYILNEQKVKFRLGSSMKNSQINSKQIEKACEIIEFFKQKAKNLGCNKIFCVGTSALRDATNKYEIKKEIFKKTKIHIKILSGEDEAYLSGFGALNLLPEIKNAVSIDIGGGSTELCLIKNGKIDSTFSLDLGTVRLKDNEKAAKIIEKSLETIPQEFRSDTVVAIGGSLRAISSAIMEKTAYPINQVHAFRYDFTDFAPFIDEIINCKTSELSNYGIKKERHDTIKTGALIFSKILNFLEAKNIITSGAGVREGVFLKDLLKQHHCFAKNYNPSLASICDRLETIKSKTLVQNSMKLFEVLKEVHYVDEKYKMHLNYAAKLAESGLKLSYYSTHKHSAYFVLSALNFKIEHKDKALIATIIENHGKKINLENNKLKELLPDFNTVAWLNFILAFAKALNLAYDDEKCTFYLEEKTLHIQKKTCNFILIENLRKIFRPKDFDIFINNKQI